jgi:hypothetical protein
VEVFLKPVADLSEALDLPLFLCGPDKRITSFKENLPMAQEERGCPARGFLKESHHVVTWWLKPGIRSRASVL